MNEVAPKFFDVDFGTAVIGYVLIFYGSTWAGLFALGQGILVDLFSVGPVGLFSLLYLAAFLSMLGDVDFSTFHSPKGQVILICTAVFLKELFLLLLLLVSPLRFRTVRHFSSCWGLPRCSRNSFAVFFPLP